MRAEPKDMLDPRIKAVWRISDTLLLTLLWLCVALPGLIIALTDAAGAELFWLNPIFWHAWCCTPFHLSCSFSW